MASYYVLQKKQQELLASLKLGTTEPCANVEVGSISTFASGSNNQKVASEITELVHKELGIDKKRFYVVLTDLQANRVSWGGNLFG
uniref:L-dopachrome isomerase n=1 Tax=Acrobeloides nanus TaxID=290746 RepID=A0A914E539_9BILA